jgi:transcriptional regulator with XRE-family HTH domain
MKNTQYLKSVGMEIRVARVRQGLTCEKLAERALITRDTLLHVEHGRNDVKLSTLKRIVDALGVSIKDIL